MRKTLVVLFALALAGCVTEQPANAVMTQKLAATCQGYGFRPGTEAHASCIFQLDQQRISSNRARRMAFADALADTGAQMQANAAAAPVYRPVNCTSRPGMNGVVRTSCY